MVDYNRLSLSYLNQQVSRIDRVRSVISNRIDIVSDGRIVPDTGDLPIGIGRRIEAAVMFLDICSFSRRNSESEKEQSNNLRVLTFLFSEMIKIVEDYGGVVEKNTGDGLMAYFSEGEGNPLGQARKRSVACALTMFYALHNMINPVIKFSSLEPVKFRICIDYGSITIAEVGAAKRFKGIVAIGTTANVAAKMLAFAQDNSLLIGANVVSGLPADWVSFAKVKNENTGWVFSASQQPYLFYEYEGRWINPTT